MIEQVSLKLSLTTRNKETLKNPLEQLAHILQRELVDRLKLGADYGNIQDESENTIGSWNIYLD
jgi:hypothetical protein|tara:strand:- start:976 stop:1167 length:192 start_codon:yes stop_codon:yes gene_type:complete